MPEKTDIIVTTFCLPEYLKLCVRCIQLHSTGYRLIVVNNGQDKETIDYLKKLKELKEKDMIVINNKTNLGYCKAINQGMKVATSELVALVTNDIMVTPGWLEGLKLMFKKFKGIGIASVMYTHASGQQDAARTDWYNKTPFFTTRVIMGCALFNKKDFWEVGGMDEKFPNIGGNFSDDDLSLRYNLKGWRNVIAPVLVFHFPSMTYTKGLVDWKKDLEGGKKYFEEKWKDEFEKSGVQVDELL